MCQIRYDLGREDASNSEEEDCTYTEMVEDFGTKLADKTVEVALNHLFERIGEALRNKPLWIRPRIARIVRAVGARLDDLILDLQPCFALGEQTSILQVFYGSGPTRDESWNRVHEMLNVLGAWFHEWDAMRRAVGIRRTPEILIRQFEALNALLTYFGLFVAGEIGKRFEDLGPDQVARAPYRVVADRYNGFLTEYESLLRRLPQEVGIEPPPLGREHFFIRI